MVPSSYLRTVVTSLIKNSSSHHERIVSFFSTTRLHALPMLLEKVFPFRNGEFRVLFILNRSTSEDTPNPSEVPVLLFASDFIDCCEFFIESVDYLICAWELTPFLIDLEESLVGTWRALEGLMMEFLLSLKLCASCLLLPLAGSGPSSEFFPLRTLLASEWLEQTDSLTSLKIEGSAYSASLARSSPTRLADCAFPSFTTFFSVHTDSAFPFTPNCPDLTSLGPSMQFSLEVGGEGAWLRWEGSQVRVLRWEVEVAMLCGSTWIISRLACAMAMTVKTCWSLSMKSAPMYLQSLLKRARRCPRLATPSSTIRFTRASSMLFFSATMWVVPRSSTMLPLPLRQQRWTRSMKVEPSEPWWALEWLFTMSCAWSAAARASPGWWSKGRSGSWLLRKLLASSHALLPSMLSQQTSFSSCMLLSSTNDASCSSTSPTQYFGYSRARFMYLSTSCVCSDILRQKWNIIWCLYGGWYKLAGQIIFEYFTGNRISMGADGDIHKSEDDHTWLVAGLSCSICFLRAISRVTNSTAFPSVARPCGETIVYPTTPMMQGYSTRSRSTRNCSITCAHTSFSRMFGCTWPCSSLRRNFSIFMTSRQSISGRSRRKYLRQSPSTNCQIGFGREALREQQKEVIMTSSKLNISSGRAPLLLRSTRTSVIKLTVLKVSGLLLRQAQRSWQQPLSRRSSFRLPMRSWMQNSMFCQKSAFSLQTELDLPPQLHSDHTTIAMSFSVKLPPLKPPTMIDSTFVQSRSLFSRLGAMEGGVMVKSQVISPTSSEGQLKMFSSILGCSLSTSSGVRRLASQAERQMAGSSWNSTSRALGSFSTLPSRQITFFPFSTSCTLSPTTYSHFPCGRLEARLRIFRLFCQEISKQSRSTRRTNSSTRQSEWVSVLRQEQTTAMSSSCVRKARFSMILCSTFPRISMRSSWLSFTLLAQCTIISTRLGSGISSRFRSSTVSTILKNDSSPPAPAPAPASSDYIIPFATSGFTFGERSFMRMKLRILKRLSYSCWSIWMTLPRILFSRSTRTASRRSWSSSWRTALRRRKSSGRSKRIWQILRSSICWQSSLRRQRRQAIMNSRNSSASLLSALPRQSKSPSITSQYWLFWLDSSHSRYSGYMCELRRSDSTEYSQVAGLGKELLPAAGRFSPKWLCSALNWLFRALFRSSRMRCSISREVSAKPARTCSGGQRRGTMGLLGRIRALNKFIKLNFDHNIAHLQTGSALIAACLYKQSPYMMAGQASSQSICQWTYSFTPTSPPQPPMPSLTRIQIALRVPPPQKLQNSQRQQFYCASKQKGVAGGVIGGVRQEAAGGCMGGRGKRGIVSVVDMIINNHTGHKPSLSPCWAAVLRAWMRLMRPKQRFLSWLRLRPGMPCSMSFQFLPCWFSSAIRRRSSSTVHSSCRRFGRRQFSQWSLSCLQLRSTWREQYWGRAARRPASPSRRGPRRRRASRSQPCPSSPWTGW